MRIGIVGAPESGKSDLAKEVASKLSEDGRQVHVIDDYVPQIEKETDLALGFFATYIGNLYVALGRFRRERIAPDVEYIITCGTLMETMVYAAIDAMASERFEKFKEEHAKRMTVCMQMLGVFTVDLWEYDRLFYVPYQHEREGHLGEFDKNLPQLLELWEIPYVTLTGDIEDKVEQALEEIREAAVAD